MQICFNKLFIVYYWAGTWAHLIIIFCFNLHCHIRTTSLLECNIRTTFYWNLLYHIRTTFLLKSIVQYWNDLFTGIYCVILERPIYWNQLYDIGMTLLLISNVQYQCNISHWNLLCNFSAITTSYHLHSQNLRLYN